MCASTIAAKARSTPARSPGATERQVPNASCARSMAASVSSSEVDGTSRNAAPVVGLISVVVVMSHPLEGAGQLPVRDGRVERRELDVRHVDVVVDDLVAEGGAG